MLHQKNMQIVAGLGIAFVIAAVMAIGYQTSAKGSGLETLFFALGGQLPTGIIQAATFAAFFICIIGIQSLWKRIRYEESVFQAKLLPETEQFVLYPEDVNDIKLNTIAMEKHLGPRLLTDLIKQATTKFRAESSTAETLSMVETVSDMQRKSMEKEFWLIGVCQTLIPAFGFLGTVWGMAAAILSMDDTAPLAAATTPGTAPVVAAGPNISALIDSMGTAFFTTILSIVLGIVVTVMMKQLESHTEEMHTNMKRYVVENLVNRIHR